VEPVISYPFLSVSAPAAVVFLVSFKFFISIAALVSCRPFEHAPFSNPVAPFPRTLCYFTLVPLDDISTSFFDHCPVAWPSVQYNGCYLASTNDLRLLEGNGLLPTHQYGPGNSTESREQCAALYGTAKFVVIVTGSCLC
jgi:hypothetical protein